MDSFVVGGQNDWRQQIAPNLTGLHQTAKQPVEAGDGRLGSRRVAVTEGEGGEVGGLGTPQRPGQGPGSHRSRYQERPWVVEVGGDVGQMDGVGDDDGPLGGQSLDDGRRVEAGDAGGGVERRERCDAERSTMIERALERLERWERRQPAHDWPTKDQQVPHKGPTRYQGRTNKFLTKDKQVPH